MVKIPNLAFAALAGLAMATSAGAKIVTITYNGVGNSNLASDPCHCWAVDAFGNSTIDRPFQAVFKFDTAQGTLTHFGGNPYLNEPGIATGQITINGHTYIGTGSTSAVYYRGTNYLYTIFYDDPAANTGIVFYVPETHDASPTPFSNQLDSPIPLHNLAPGDVSAATGSDAVLPGFGGALRTGLTTTSFSVSVAPEPATWATMLIGVAGVGGALRRHGRRCVRSNEISAA